MALVSSIYRMAPPSGYRSRDEHEHALRLKMRRLVAQWGAETVVTKIRRHPVDSKDEEVMKAWLVLTAYAEERKGQRQASW